MRRLNPKNWEQNRLSYTKDAAQVVLEGLADNVAIGYVKMYGERASYLVFYGKQSRPAVHFSAKSAEAASQAVTRYLTEAKTRHERNEAAKAVEKAKPKLPYHTYERGGITVRSYDTAGTAVLIREALKKAFPTTKFSVRSSTFAGGSSVDISYTDGPAYAAVDAICDEFQYGDFNSMDDSYNHRDNSVLVDENGPYYVSYDAKYVHVSRSYSAAYGHHCHTLDLRTAPDFSAQIQCWHRLTRNQYSYGDVKMHWHEATGNVMLGISHHHEQLVRFADNLKAQGLATEIEDENGLTWLAIYGAHFAWQEEYAN
jgi:hypothetical protein